MNLTKTKAFFPVAEIDGELKGGYYSQEGYWFSSEELETFVEQKQVLTDEEIEKLAEKEYPMAEIQFKDFEISNKSIQGFNNALRKGMQKAFIKGFKSALK